MKKNKHLNDPGNQKRTTSSFVGLSEIIFGILTLSHFIAAPDDRWEKVFNEINRPTFAKLKPPLPKICKFIPYSELKREIDQIGYRVRYMKPEFIDEIAESCEPDEI